MTVKITNVTGYIVPIGDGTKLRPDYTTYSTAIASYPAGTRVDVDQVIERLDTDADKVHNYKGDKWGRVISINGVVVSQTCYMAISYHNSSFVSYPICKEFYSVNQEEPETPPSEDTVFPDFILVYGSMGGENVEVKYVKE